MPLNNDPLGYYGALGVGPSASIDKIKKAFKAKARELHPDKNGSADATCRFQFLNEAYQVLINPCSRSEYDATVYTVADPPEDPKPNRRPVQPVTCCVCGKVSVQPRYVIYRQVVSFIFATYRTGCQGVYCAKCGAKQAYKTSAITWLLGWWGIPWGPIYSIHAILRNMLGGEQPAITNFRVLAMQAAHFVSENRMDLARLLADQALGLISKIAAFRTNQETMSDRDLKALLMAIQDDTPSPHQRLKASWGARSLPFRLQAFAGGLVTLIVSAFLVSGASHTRTAFRHVAPGKSFDQFGPSGGEKSAAQLPSTNLDADVGPRSNEPPSSQLGIKETVPFNEPAQPLPPTGGMHILHKRSGDVRAPLKISSYPASPNYYIKLVDLNTQVPVLFLFIRSGESVSTEVPLGRYELRLADGDTWFGEEYCFGPQTGYSKADTELIFERDGDQLAGYTLRLQKQVDGNLRETRIAASDF